MQNHPSRTFAHQFPLSILFARLSLAYTTLFNKILICIVGISGVHKKYANWAAVPFLRRPSGFIVRYVFGCLLN